jgi:hypothetical protein
MLVQQQQSLLRDQLLGGLAFMLSDAQKLRFLLRGAMKLHTLKRKVLHNRTSTATRSRLS